MRTLSGFLHGDLTPHCQSRLIDPEPSGSLTTGENREQPDPYGVQDTRHRCFATLLAVALPLATASSASAVEKRGGCSQGKAHYEFDVEKDDGRFEVDFEVDSNVRGQTWRLTLHHDGKRVFRDVRTTNREGEVGFERNRPNTAGRDAFRAKAVNLGNGEVCTARIVRR